MKIPVDVVTLVGFALALMRASVFIFVAPPFNSRSIPMPVKGGLAAALALTVAPHVPNSNPTLDIGPFAGAMLTQALVGLAMAMTMVVLMTAIQSAGALIDTFAGFSIATLYDPFADNTTSLFGRFYQLLATTLLFASNGHLVIIRGFFASFKIIPADSFQPVAIVKILSLNVAELFVAALEIAGPVVGCLFLSELSMGLVSRAAPSLNIFSLAFPIRIGVTMLVVALAVPLLSPAVTNLVELGVRSFLGH